MYRAVTEELTWHDYRSRIFSQAQDIMSDNELEAFRTEMGYEPLSSKARKALLQKYNSKIQVPHTARRRHVLSEGSARAQRSDRGAEGGDLT
jgi:hypothetical protein